MNDQSQNPAYWREVDLRLQYLNDSGIVGGLVLAWGAKNNREPYSWNRFPSLEDRKRYVRYVIARYAAYNVYFILSGEWHGEVNNREDMSNGIPVTTARWTSTTALRPRICVTPPGTFLWRVDIR